MQLKLDKRLKILKDDERAELYGFPHFDEIERRKYFTLDSAEQKEFLQLRSVSSKIYFILALGYFKAKQQFFGLSQEATKNDIHYIHKRYLTQYPILCESVATSTRLTHKTRILKLCQYQECSKETRKCLLSIAYDKASICYKPIYIFKELVEYLKKNHIILPAYSFFQDIIGKALEKEKKRLEKIITSELPKSIIADFQRLLDSKDGFYELTFIKKEPKNFTYKIIKAESKKRQKIDHLYQFACQLIPKLKISNENLNYYASLVNYYSIFRLKQIKSKTVFIYLICFIYRPNGNIAALS